jgi:hypothetical protein
MPGVSKITSWAAAGGVQARPNRSAAIGAVVRWKLPHRILVEPPREIADFVVSGRQCRPGARWMGSCG